MEEGEGREETRMIEDNGDRENQLRERKLGEVEVGKGGVEEEREHVRNGVGHHGLVLFYLRRGMPRPRRRARPSASVRAEVTRVMFIPLILSTLS